MKKSEFLKLIDLGQRMRNAQRYAKATGLDQWIDEAQKLEARFARQLDLHEPDEVVLNPYQLRVDDEAEKLSA